MINDGLERKVGSGDSNNIFVLHYRAFIKEGFHFLLC
jgi:hypothetical protein